MLARTDRSVVNVALSVGFQTQSHFTSVFKRFAGQPPRAWRESQALQARPPRPPVPIGALAPALSSERAMRRGEAPMAN